MDGGTVYNTDSNDAIQGCLDAGYAEEDIVLDIIGCNTSSIYTTENGVSKNAFDNWQRSRELQDISRSTN
jgi:hypothetical protein